ncbi:MAG: FG-GAP repeat domain-containing protein, partial [Armatimonadota bacterium]
VHYRRVPGAPPVPPRPRPPAAPALEPGFPTQAWHGPGGYHGGPALHTLVGDVDGDPQLEIVVTSVALGPLNAWNHDGTPVSGWPVGTAGAAYPALAEDLPTRRVVVAGNHGGLISAYAANGSVLPGWPRVAANYIDTPPATADVDGAPPDELFIEEEDWQLHGYRLDGTILQGWPVYAVLGSQERHTPAYADLDGDGDLEILTITGSGNGIVYLLAYHHNGSPVAGFPVSFPGPVDVFPAVGDVDGDGQLEIVVVQHYSVLVISTTGVIERSIALAGTVGYGAAPALADLDGDRTPEIIVQAEDYLNVLRGNGTAYPGWPVALPGRWAGSSAPVIGDVDGDPEMEIAIVTQQAGSSEFGEVRVYNANGTPHPRFPKALNLGHGTVPAIADIDRDRRNEIVICGAYWNGFSGFYDKCWAYDLGSGPHGRIEWGQFGGNGGHHGRYPVPAWTAAIGLYAPSSSTFYERNASNGGPASTTFAYGPAASGWVPLIGDWNGDRIETAGLYDPVTSTFFLRNSNSGGLADLTFGYGPPGVGWVPVVGDWNGDGIDTIGLYNPGSGTFFLRNSNSAGPADITFNYGPAIATWTPIVGDWNGDGMDTVGLYHPLAATFFLRNANSPGPADLTFAYGPALSGFAPVVGDWNGDRTDTVGVYNGATGTFFLRNSNSPGPANLTFTYGPPGLGWVPLVGDWDGL